MHKLFFIFLCCYLSFIFTAGAQSPSPQLFTLDEFIEQVKKYHPLALQAQIKVEKRHAALQTAKGSFDPSLHLSSREKTIDGKNYYTYFNTQLSIPLPAGTIVTGIENNSGDNLLPEITKGRSSYAGIEIPLANGLLFDKRRAVLQQAKLLVNQSAQERAAIINHLLFEAYIAYGQWAAYYQLYRTFANFSQVALDRMRLVRIAYANGERAMADTVEAYTQVQQYQLMQSEAFVRLTNAKLELSNYLWQQDSAYSLHDHIVPDTLSHSGIKPVKPIEELLAQSSAANPVFGIYNFKLQMLEVEKRLKRQSLLPYVSVKANLLNNNYYPFNNISTHLLENNYNWGFHFTLPLFLRSARGEYKLAQLKLKETSLELMFKRQQTENKLRSYYTEYHTLFSQLQTVKKMYENYQFLLRAEELKFAQGESSLFLVNTREIKVLEMIQKQIDLTFKSYKARIAMEWAAGLLQ